MAINLKWKPYETVIDRLTYLMIGYSYWFKLGELMIVRLFFNFRNFILPSFDIVKMSLAQ